MWRGDQAPGLAPAAAGLTQMLVLHVHHYNIIHTTQHSMVRITSLNMRPVQCDISTSPP